MVAENEKKTVTVLQTLQRDFLKIRCKNDTPARKRSGVAAKKRENAGRTTGNGPGPAVKMKPLTAKTSATK